MSRIIAIGVCAVAFLALVRARPFHENVVSHRRRAAFERTGIESTVSRRVLPAKPAELQTVPVRVTNARTGVSQEATANVVATGFSWAENLIFDGEGRLIVNELVRGEVYVIRPNGDGTFTSTIVLSGLAKLLGLAIDPNNATHVFAAGRLPDANQTTVIIQFSTAASQTIGSHSGIGSYSVVATMPSLSCVPNGLGLHIETGLLYTACEGDWVVPGTARIYEINPATGSVSPVVPVSGEPWTADGLWIDQTAHTLYVGQLIPGNVWAYDLTTKTDLGWITALDGGFGGWLDDFTLSASGEMIIGAAWMAKQVVAFPAVPNNSTKPVVVLEGINHPTSMRFARGPGFNSTSLFITEGDGVFSFQTSDRVLELPNAAQLFGVDDL